MADIDHESVERLAQQLENSPNYSPRLKATHTLRALRTALDAAEAREAAAVAAALREAAIKIVSLPGGTVMHSPPQLLSEAHDAILARITPDAHSALDRMLSEEREKVAARIRDLEADNAALKRGRTFLLAELANAGLPVKPEHFGAVADGVTDCTAAARAMGDET